MKDIYTRTFDEFVSNHGIKIPSPEDDNRKEGQMNQVPLAPSEVLLVNFVLTHGPDNRICIVGKKDGDKGAITIVNAFEGQQAEDIFNLLTTVIKKGNENEGEF